MGHGLEIECPEIVDAAASSRQNQDLRIDVFRFGPTIDLTDGRGNLVGGAVTLHAGWPKEHPRRRPTVAEDRQHIVNRGPLWAGDYGDATRAPRQAALPARIEVAKLLQLFL